MSSVDPGSGRPFRQVICIGLDGATFDVIDPMIAAGRLPNLAKLMENGTRSRLASTVPPLTAPAWVSFMTGLNPGRHGVFHFRAMEERTLSTDLVGSWMYRGRTIFDRASKDDLETIAFRVPMTYPAWPINGVMVSGFPTPDPRTNFSHPPELGSNMDPLVKLAPVASMMAGIEDQIDNFEYYIERSTKAILDLMEARRPDFFCYVNSITDWIAHKFWRFSDPAAPGYEPHPMPDGTLLEHFYDRVDESVGRILEAADDDAFVLVLSDHGTGPRTNRRFNTNAWLQEQGLLVRSSGQRGRKAAAGVVAWLKDVAPKKHWLWRKVPDRVRRSTGALRAYGGAIRWESTRAYRVEIDHHVEGINVNLSGREPHGSVAEEDYETVRDEILAAAKDLRDPATGKKVVDRACRRENLYEGPFAGRAPDVVLILNPSVEAGHSAANHTFSEVADSRLERSSATHRPDGIFIASGPGVRSGFDLGDASLVDAPATLLWSLGLELPAEMDGRVPEEAFEPGLFEAHPIRRTAESSTTTSDGAYSDAEEEQVAAHLEDLGYL